MICIKPYSPALLSDWEQVVEFAINGTFMHSRAFMEYHGERFKDASLVIYNDGHPVGIFPAHRVEDRIHSHQGLTYGGLILNPKLSMGGIIAVIKEVLRYYHELQIRKLNIKDVPSFYGSSSLEWMPYCMFLLKAENFRTDLSFAIPLPASPSRYSKGRKWGINKARKNGMSIRETRDFRPFWEEVLVPNLWERHRVKPVHTLEEIQFLAQNNHPYIRQFEVLEAGNILAGSTVFETKTTAHTQYLSANPRGKELGALDLLLDHLLVQVFPHKAFFDFGIVNENQGLTINKGLMEWKESFGAKPYVHQFYRVEPKWFGVLENVMK